ncbi:MULTISPECIES: N-acetylmuramoyl-L-alanine amidase [unclassified Yoonia]|uniref:N-acetylmuramoyl-L-alanine amidase n=1 Tax=unclassified Yoonia TaxID=2629118 RepID=UPI002AFFD5E6|nr:MULTISPECIES: N-acetylmuramoyl-L-alanine amidase [unclassified Yoonia]
MVVIHYTAMASAQAACDTLCNPVKQVSAHYVIAEDGSVTALVPEDLRAWHAGVGRWGSVTDVNSHSIGIELANNGTSPFAAPLMDTLCDLLAGIMDRWDIRPERVIGHSDMAPGRKIDPGPRFDWRRLALQGLSVWPETGEADPDDFATMMRAFGYTATDDPDLLLDIFRLRFRPWAQGPLDRTDAGLISDLARRFPVDGGPPAA